MRIIVKVKTRSRKEGVERMKQTSLFARENEDRVVYKVSVKEAPVGGKANEAVAQALAKYFNISVSKVRLVSGQTFKQKVFELDDVVS